MDMGAFEAILKSFGALTELWGSTPKAQGTSAEEVDTSQRSLTLVEGKRKADMKEGDDEENSSFNSVLSGNSLLGKRPNSRRIVKLEKGECSMGAKKFPQLEIDEEAAFIHGGYILDVVLLGNKIVGENRRLRKVSDKGGACKVVIPISSALFFGNTKSWFGASRGVRLCDPLSTFLFALMAMYIRVKRSKTTYFLQCDPTETILDVKQKLHTLIDQPINDQRLILVGTGEILDDSKTLADQKVENDAVVALTLRKVVSYNLPLEQSRFFEVSASFCCALFPRGFHTIFPVPMKSQALSMVIIFLRKILVANRMKEPPIELCYHALDVIIVSVVKKPANLTNNKKKLPVVVGSNLLFLDPGSGVIKQTGRCQLATMFQGGGEEGMGVVVVIGDNCVELDDNEFEDVNIVRPNDDFYQSRDPDGS
ncbi:hypothetical protein CK203_004217 [Vitis vinifera]|uniref:Ubiquitin-like domain-containing protein n=1 Tax=Vitis vinifera TaxID=29760 RepID=A0A438K9D8_VITVI|nr:hypothetical protein CK203_004217 [Vitis vinifera]